MIRFGFTFYPLVNFGVFEQDAFNEALLLHAVEAVGNLVFIRHEQRPAALKRDADLNAGKSSAPAGNDPSDRTGDAAVLANKDGNRSGAPVRRTAVRLT